MARIGARQSAAQLQRDGALRRVGLTRRVAIGGAAALTGGIAAFVSAVAPGRTLGATGTANARYEAAYRRYLAERAQALASASTTMPPLASPSSLGLAAGAPPQAAPAPQVQSSAVQPAAVQPAPVAPAPPPVVVSGGS